MGAAQCRYSQLGINWQDSLRRSSRAHNGMRLCCSEALIKKRREKIAEVLLMRAVCTNVTLRQCCNADVVQDSVLTSPLEVAIFNCVKTYQH